MPLKIGLKCASFKRKDLSDLYIIEIKNGSILIAVTGSLRVDVVLLTKNSLKPCLLECVKSIYENVPVNRLIVIDGGSTDGTIEFLEKMRDVEIIDDSGGNRATARQNGLNLLKLNGISMLTLM